MPMKQSLAAVAALRGPAGMIGKGTSPLGSPRPDVGDGQSSGGVPGAVSGADLPVWRRAGPGVGSLRPARRGGRGMQCGMLRR